MKRGRFVYLIIMKCSKFLVALVGLLGLALHAQDAAPAEWTLPQAIAAVLARYPSVGAAREGLEAARARTTQSRAATQPQVSVDGSYSYLDPLSYIDFTTPDGTRRIFEQTHDNYDASVGVHQLISDFGRTRAAIQLARTGEATALDTIEQVRLALGYETIQLFYAGIYLRDSVAVTDEELHALQEALRVAQQKFSGGRATKFDVLTTQVRLANAENRRTDTVAALQRQEARLRALLGIANGQSLVLRGEFVPDTSGADRSGLLAEAALTRPEIRLAHDAEVSAQARVSAADLGDRPALNASVNGGARDGYAPSLNATKPYIAATVGVSVPLFTGHRTAGEQREARANLRAAQFRRQEQELVAASEIDTALANLTASTARLARSDTIVDQAHEALALAQTRYANGVITNFELLDAQSAAREAELSRLQARYDCVLSRQALNRVIGRPASG